MEKGNMLPDSGLSLPTTMYVIFRTNGDPRVIGYTKPPVPYIGADLQHYPTPPEDSPPLKIPRISIEPHSTLKCSRGKRPLRNGLQHKKCNRDAEWRDRNSSVLSVPIQRIVSESDHADEPTFPQVHNDANLTYTAGMFKPEVGSDAQPDTNYLFEATSVTEELLLEPSSTYRLSWKPKIDSMNPGLTSPLDSQSPDGTLDSQSPDGTSLKAKDDAVDGTAEVLAEKTTEFNCRLPTIGHIEDVHHYRCCAVISAGFILRQKHTDWLCAIPSHSGIMKVVDLTVGTSCKQILLNGKCSEEQCTSKHVIDLNFNIPHKQFAWVFNIVNKWFLENAVQPYFRAILIMLAQLSKDSNDTFMMVLSYAKMIPKLSDKKYKQALSIKLIEIMVNVLGYQPWEAVRALLIFIVTPETELSDILDFLSTLEVTTSHTLQNHLHESVTCLWHISESFVCPSPLLFKLLKESVAQMPVDVKLTKDRMLADLLKQPKPLLRREFPSVDKFLSKYYPQNSEIVRVFRTSLLYGVEAAKSAGDFVTYETSKVTGTGPVNPQWHYWDIQEARIKAFEMVVKNAHKPQKETKLRSGPLHNPAKENIEVDVWSHDLFKMLASRNCLCYDKGLPSYDFVVEEPNDLDCLVESLVSNKLGKVVSIMLSCGKSPKADSFEKCLQTLQREFERCDKTLIGLVVFELLQRLPGSLSDDASVKSCFVRTVNALVVKFYREDDYKSALKLLKAMRLAGVNHLEHAPKGTNQQTFAIVCSDINFQCRLYLDAIRTLMYKNCLHFVDAGFNRRFPEHFYQLEKLVTKMLKHFLKERHASHALDIFRLIFSIQENLHFPLNIGRYYEGVVFLSFVRDLKKNVCSAGDGASLYITVERVCGNSEPFHSITYRSLLVELHRTNSPEDVIRRVLWICMTKQIYPDFSEGPVSPLVMGSHLAHEEMSIYLKHFFTYFLVQNNLHRLTAGPFVVRFSECPPPAEKPFPVSNDIMKTPRTIPDALERLKSVLDGFSSELYQTLDAEFSQDGVTIPVKGVEKILQVFKQ